MQGRQTQLVLSSTKWEEEKWEDSYTHREGVFFDGGSSGFVKKVNENKKRERNERHERNLRPRYGV